MKQQAWVRAAYDRHAGPLYAYVRRLTRDDDRSRDIVQDAFARLCEQPDTVNAGPWLYSVARNRAIDIARKEQRMSALAEITLPARERNPAEALETQDDTRSLLEQLAVLPASQQEAVRLKFHEQFSYREIADVMNISVGHVGVLLHEALKTLRLAMT